MLLMLDIYQVSSTGRILLWWLWYWQWLRICFWTHPSTSFPVWWEEMLVMWGDFWKGAFCCIPDWARGCRRSSFCEFQGQRDNSLLSTHPILEIIYSCFAQIVTRFMMQVPSQVGSLFLTNQRLRSIFNTRRETMTFPSSQPLHGPFL